MRSEGCEAPHQDPGYLLSLGRGEWQGSSFPANRRAIETQNAQLVSPAGVAELALSVPEPDAALCAFILQVSTKDSYSIPVNSLSLAVAKYFPLDAQMPAQVIVAVVRGQTSADRVNSVKFNVC